MATIAAALDSLDRDARRRVLQWVTDRYTSQPTPPPGRKTRTPKTRRTPTIRPPAGLPDHVIETGRQIAATGTPLTRRNLTTAFRERGHTLSTDRATALLHALKDR